MVRGNMIDADKYMKGAYVTDEEESLRIQDKVQKTFFFHGH